MTMLGTLLAFALALLAVIGVAVVILNVTLRRLVHRRHQELEEIANGRLPDAWTSGLWRHPTLSRWRCQRRLSVLSRDVERSTLIDDEQTRAYLLERLATMRSTLRTPT